MSSAERNAPANDDAEINVQRLMGEIRAEVEWKRRAGLYPPEVLEELDMSLGASPRDYLDAALQLLRRTTKFSAVVPTASQKGIAAPLAATFKRTVQRSTSWYISAVLQQVELFAARATRTIGLLADRVNRFEDDVSQQVADAVAELRATVDRLSGDVSRVHGDLEETRLRDRVALLERSLRGLHERVGNQAPGHATPAPDAPRGAASDFHIDYLDFENQFRGTEEQIKEKQRSYVELFADAQRPVADLGCGRGEFLEMLRDAGVRAYGVDRHHDMVDLCRQKGLDAREEDAIAHLSSVGPSSLGGIFCAQVVEHLEANDVPRLLELAFDALAPGGILAVETLNPGSLSVFSGPFYVDLGHLRPVHPLTLKFLATKAGFAHVELAYYSRPSADVRPEPIGSAAREPVGELIEKINANFSRIDDAIFGPQDYAVIATR